MRDIVLDRPDGLEFGFSAESSEADRIVIDPVERLGLEKLNPDSVGRRWQVTEKGIYVVDITELMDRTIDQGGMGHSAIEQFTTGGPLLGLITVNGSDTRRPDKTIAYVAGAEFIRDWKEDLGLEGGFKVVGRSTTDDRYELAGSQFFGDRARGFWSILSPKEGAHITETNKKLYAIGHDLNLRGHLPTALASTDRQVEQTAALRAKCYELGGVWTSLLIGAIMPDMLDHVFSIPSPSSLKLSPTSELREKIRAIPGQKLGKNVVGWRRIEAETDAFMQCFDQIISTAEEETGFDSDAEANLAKERLQIVQRYG